MKKTILYVSLIATLSPFACSKKEDPEPAKTKTEMLTDKTWKLQSATSLGIDIRDYYLDDCAQDDLLKFSSSGTYIQTDAGVKCTDAPEPGTWSFSNNEMNLVWDGEPLKIEEFTSTKISLSEMVEAADGKEYKADLVFVAQ